MVEGTGLENRHTDHPYRGFESLPLRRKNISIFTRWESNAKVFALHWDLKGGGSLRFCGAERSKIVAEPGQEVLNER